MNISCLWHCHLGAVVLVKLGQTLQLAVSLLEMVLSSEEGLLERGGRPHAETQALTQAGKRAQRFYRFCYAGAVLSSGSNRFLCDGTN